MRPTPLTKQQIVKVLKAAGYIAVSGALSALTSWAAKNPELFGPLWPVINVLLVVLKQVFTKA